MSNTSSFHWHNIFSFYPAPNLIKLTLYLIWSWKYERYVPPCLKFYVFLKYHSAPFLQPTFLSWIRNNLMFYPFLERNPSGETQLKSLKKTLDQILKLALLPSFEFHTLLSEETEFDCFARKHLGILLTQWISFYRESF